MKPGIIKPETLKTKINFEKEYGLIGILIILGLYLISLLNNYLLYLIGLLTKNNNIILTANFYLETIFGPVHYLFLIVVIAGLVMTWKKHRFYWIPLLLIFLTKTILMLRVKTPSSIILSLKEHLTGVNVFEYFIAPLIIYLLLITYILIKKFKQENENIELITIILSFLYVVFVWF